MVLFEGETVEYLVYSCMVPAATTTTEIIAPGAERVLHLGSWWQVFIAELAPTPGRMGSTLRATIAMLVGIVLMALVGNSAFIMCPVTSMTESTPGTLHSPGLLLRRILTSVACGAYSIMLVAAFAQARPFECGDRLGVVDRNAGNAQRQAQVFSRV